MFDVCYKCKYQNEDYNKFPCKICILDCEKEDFIIPLNIITIILSVISIVININS